MSEEAKLLDAARADLRQAETLLMSIVLSERCEAIKTEAVRCIDSAKEAIARARRTPTESREAVLELAERLYAGFSRRSRDPSPAWDALNYMVRDMWIGIAGDALSHPGTGG